MSEIPRPRRGSTAGIRPGPFWPNGVWLTRVWRTGVCLTGLCLAWTIAGCRGGGAWLVDVAAEKGVDFSYHSGASGGLFMPEIMGGGVGLVDWDQDGDLDLYLSNGNDDLPGFGDGEQSDRLYRQDADGRFTDITADSGLNERSYSMGVAAGDIDNDGLPDLYVTNVGPDRLYRNLGGGRFQDITASAAIDESGWSVSAVFCDYDRDGLLDLYVARYLDFDAAVVCQSITGEREYCGPRAYRPLSDLLFHNEGEGRFRNASTEAGLPTVAAAGLGVVCADVSDDGLPDFYVANDGHANDLWINQGDGSFVNRAIEAGAAYNLRGQAQAGMGVVAEDLDGDLRIDFFVTNLRDETNVLYQGQPGGSAFLDITAGTGLGPPSLPLTGFGVAASDLDLDGDLELAIADGRVKGYDPHPDAAVDPPWNRLAEPGLLFVADPGGRFQLAENALCGDHCRKVDVARGLAAGDIDGDGDLDLVRGGVASPLRILENRAPRGGGHWLQVRAVDPRLKRDAVGARVTLRAGSASWLRLIGAGGSYASASPLEAHFGLGQAATVDAVDLLWPDGMRETFDVDCVDCRIVLRRGDGRSR
ncbi:MAG TPA: CRTAC1 family protein [Anaerolineae bacterium]|nr:CRTAC1 family protein [Anaerolineae bacterium]